MIRIKAERDLDRLKVDERKLEYMIADFVKEKEGIGTKIRKMKELCDE